MKNDKVTILCVDDDPDFLDSLRPIIESGDYAMETAGSAEEGLKKFKQVTPDVVIVDLMMEQIDSGTSLVKQIRDLGKTLPIYMLSSVGNSLGLNIDPADLKVDGVFQKPINPKTFLNTLKTRLSSKSPKK